MSAASVPSCDYCGRLEWTLNTDGRVSHKHDCPHRTDDFCQAHPVGCPEWLKTYTPPEEVKT